MLSFKEYLTEERSSKEIQVQGVFDQLKLAQMHRKDPFVVGDVLINRKGERFRVTSIKETKRYMNGQMWTDGVTVDIVGLNKGKVFTIYVR